MKQLAHSLLSLAICLFLSVDLKAQDPQYSQFYSNLLMLNPAFAGSGRGPRVAVNSRAQWVKIPGYYQQAAISFDMPLFIGQTNQGWGMNLSYDQAGEGNLKKIDFTLNYAYELDLTGGDKDHLVRFGISAGGQQATLDYFRLIFPDQIDRRDGVRLPTNEPLLAGGLNPTQYRPDVNAGIAYFNDYAFVGVTVNHLTEPEQRFYTDGGQGAPPPAGIDARLPRKYTVTGGVKLPVGPYSDPDKVTVTPAFLYKQQGEFSQIDAGLYVNIEPMVFGVWYRNQDAMIGLIGISKDQFSFGYSFDYTISDLSQGVSGGSHELSLVLEFDQYQKSRFKHKPPPCPRF